MGQQTDLKEAAAAADELPDPHDVIGRDEEVPLEEVFDDAFVSENTDFETFDELVAASPSEASSAAELDRVSDREWDEFVAESTIYDDEKEFVFAARDHWVGEKLGLN